MTIRKFDDIPDIMTLEIPPIEYLVDGMIARGTVIQVAGADGTAKTLEMQKMGIAVAMGGTFLGRRCQQAPVLYLDYENPAFAVRKRLDVMAGGPIPGLKVWGTWLPEQPPQIGNDLLLTIAKERKPLIIIDPFRCAHGAEENDSTQMTAVMQHLRSCAAAGAAVVIVHHLAKSEGSTGRGSTAIRSAADVAFLQEMSDQTGLITLTCVKNRFGARHKMTIRADYDQMTFSVTNGPEFEAQAAELEHLRQIIAENPGLTQNAIFKRSGGNRTRILNLLKPGRNDQLWITSKRGKSLLYYPPGFPHRNADLEQSKLYADDGVPSTETRKSQIGT